MGRTGYFPSKNCIRLAPGEKPLQVKMNVTVSEKERSDYKFKLTRDQIVIQVIIIYSRGTFIQYA